MRSDRLNIALAHTNNEVIVNHNNGFDLIRIGMITIAKKKADMIYKMNLYQQNKIIPIRDVQKTEEPKKTASNRSNRCKNFDSIQFWFYYIKN